MRLRHLRNVILFCILFFLSLFTFAADSDNAKVPAKENVSPGQFVSTVHSYAKAVKLAAPSVVNVYNRHASAASRYNYSPYNPRSRRRYRLGSGVIVNKQGYILTNYHLIRQATRVLVMLDDGRKATAKVIGSDPETDLSVLKINLKNLSPIQTGNSDDLKVGDVVLAIGNPFGLGQTVTQGIVSALGRSTIGINELENYIQTDAAINPGNSGGALINTSGKLVGINTAIYTRSGGYQGVGFAIPVNTAIHVMNQIIKYGKVVRGWLGIDVRMLSSAYARSIRSKITSGVVITRVIPDSPAAKAGLKRDDIITKVNGRRIRQARGLSSVIAHLKPGSTVRVTIVRNNKARQVKVMIGTRRKQATRFDRTHPSRQSLPQRRYPDNYYMPQR